MKVLIDGIEHESTSDGYIKGHSLMGDEVLHSYHRTIDTIQNPEENLKVVSGGYVYVLNYNKETFIPKAPMTYNEYKKMQDEN